MPRLRRRSKLRNEISDSQRSQLQHGHDFCGDAWGNEPFNEQTLGEMQDAWEQLGEELEAEHVVKFPGQRCWGWWQWSSPEPQESACFEPQWPQLERLGLLTDFERAGLRKAAMHRVQCSGRFRRSAEWWHFVSPNGRDESQSEVGQLLTECESLLLDVEREIINDKTEYGFPITRDRLSHLSQPERLLLGLPV